MPNALSLLPPDDRDLTVLKEAKLITDDEHRVLSRACQAVAVMQAVSSPSESRPFQFIQVMDGARTPTPIAQARQALASLAQVWGGSSSSFHQYREMFFDARLRKAKVAKMRKQAEVCVDEDERAIILAEADLEQARIDKIEAEVARGTKAMEGTIAKAKRCSEQYALLCKDHQFTEQDFQAEETRALVRSAWWHAAMIFTTVDIRDRFARPSEQAKTREDDYRQRQEAKRHRRMDLRQEVVLLFQVMGYSEQDIKNGLGELLQQREHFNIAYRGNPAPPSFAPIFSGWLDMMTKKHPRTFSDVDLENIRRIAAIIDQTKTENSGPGEGAAMDRPGVTF